MCFIFSRNNRWVIFFGRKWYFLQPPAFWSGDICHFQNTFEIMYQSDHRCIPTNSTITSLLIIILYLQNGDETDKRAVFIVNDLILDTCEQIIHDIISNSNFKNCVVITSVSQSLHQHLTSTASDVPQSTEPGEGNDFFKEVEAKLVAWMNQEVC